MSHIKTAAVHAGEAPRLDGSVVFPVFQSATFTCEEAMQPGLAYGAIRYTRCNNNPSQLAVASKVAQLEGAEAALVTTSGMAAISTTLLTFLSAGDHLIVQRCLYGGTYSLVHETLPRLGIQVTEVDINDPDSWAAAFKNNTKLMYVETINNPLCGMADLPAVVRECRSRGVLTCVDNTFASPANFRPILFGFDLVVESATKFLNGHSDVVAGIVAGSKQLIDKVLDSLNHLGGALDPHACFLLQRGLKTLGVRVAQQNANALALATALEQHPAVSKVHYPGLPSHPQHTLARSLFTNTPSSKGSPPSSNGDANGHSSSLAQSRTGGYGGMVAFELRGGLAAAQVFLKTVQLATFAPSLGGVETLVVLPATATHAGQTPEQRAALGITDGLIRVSVGIEDTADLVEDFIRALDAVDSRRS